MSKRMLIDASHPEETRVVVLDGNKVEEFDFESAAKRPLKGNIYLAKVTRVEPSLQAAFVEYGGNRQGFLAFPEIHPDYYQIPVADRQALIEAQKAEARRIYDEDEGFEHVEIATVPAQQPMPVAEGEVSQDRAASTETVSEQQEEVAESETASDEGMPEAPPEDQQAETESNTQPIFNGDEPINIEVVGEPRPLIEEPAPAPEPTRERERGPRPRRRHYKIQEVIKRRQIMLVQVVKEERGTKGAALTTYLSLAGRYCVLMPNTPRGGGISRKITSATDRRRLKSAAQSLELPEGMGLIIRTAGANRTKVEIKRDYEYLLRLWDTVRELTLKSNAPALVYEEGNIIKRAIRDLYNKDIEEVLVDGDGGYRDAKDFMRMIMPSHAKNVKPYKEPLPLFQRFHVETQLDAMFSPMVTLKSGGYIVINQTEALVSIDVNSGKATREHSIEETAHKTNLEAADEIGRQLRLRDLAGLIVIDFIDMEEGKNDRHVEKRLRDAVRGDRARIQIGKISQFGLMEMSRQRLRVGVVASSSVTCPHCGGTGLVRSTESAALRLLRALDEEGQHQQSSNLSVKAPSEVVIYALNQKRREIARIEEAYDLSIAFDPQPHMIGGTFEIDRTGPRIGPPRPKSTAVSVEAGFTSTEESEPEEAVVEEEEIIEEELAEEEEEVLEEDEQPEREPQHQHSHPHQHQQQQGQHFPPGEGAQGVGGRKRRRRHRGGRGRNHGDRPHVPGVLMGAQQTTQHIPQAEPAREGQQMPQQAAAPMQQQQGQPQQGQQFPPGEGGGRRRRRRRGRRGRGRHGEGFQGQPGQQNYGQQGGGQQNQQGVHTARGEDHKAEPVAPNAPSAPQWSLAGEAHEPRHEHAAPRDHKPEPKPERAPEPAPAAATSAESRKGWWQRNFKL